MISSTKRGSAFVSTISAIAAIIAIISACYVVFNYFHKIKPDLDSMHGNFKKLDDRFDNLEARLDVLTSLISKVLYLHEEQLTVYERKILRTNFESNKKEGKPTITGTYAPNSPRAVFYTDERGLNPKSIPFDGESLNSVWSSDLSKIFFQGKNEHDSDYDIYCFDLKTKSIFNLTKGNGDNKEPFLAPNGFELYFSSKRNGPTHGIMKMNIDGSNQQLVYRDEGYDLELPSISPDGKLLGYSLHSQNGWDLWVMDVNNPNQKLPISNGGGFCRMRWNPNTMDEVVYVEDRRKAYKDDGKKQGDVKVGILKIDNFNKLQFEEIFNLTKYYYASKYPNCPSDNYPDWSIDGSQIIFANTTDIIWSKDSNNWILYIANKDGTKRRIFGEKEIRAYLPRWPS